ncbi:MAG: AraC family transcriptional regulator, partial [Pseudomonadota bacterium]|nr:AraC family transcriptional regulator [Pseudomonadota bacterium]
MFDDPSDAPLVVDFLLVPDFSLIAFAAAMEPLRLANRVAGRELYRWRITSLDGQAVVASGGVPVAVDHATDAGGRIRVLILCSGLDVQRQIDDRLLGLLRRVSRQGAMVGAVCTGAYALARAGLLNNRRSTIHWENLGGFSEAFPEIETSADLFEIDRDRFTCSGGTAALDMMLHLIGR